MLDFTRKLTFGSALRYVRWRLVNKSKPLMVVLGNGVKFFIRSDVSENNDYGVVYEVFVHNYYQPLPELDRSKVRLVVDLGGNVGMSVLHWLAVFPSCTVETFEPNPLHVAQMRRNLALSDQSSRVRVHPQGVGARTRMVHFSSLGTSTSAFTASDNMFEAELVDVFECFHGKRIDLMKLDVEGGEYELLEDPRFGELDIGAIVMEWHTRGNDEADRQWCEQRLTDMGFTIRPLFTEQGHGMFWAVKSQVISETP